MALNRNSTYGQRWSTPSDDGPQGSYKNKSDPTDTQASYLEANVLNDSFDGWQGAMLHQASGQPTNYVTPTFPLPLSGTQDTATNSQVYNAWYKKTQDIVDAKISSEIQDILDGCYFQYYSQSEFDVSGFSDSDFTTLPLNDPDGSGSGTLPTINSNNITIDPTTHKITFLVAGTYFINMAVYNEHWNSNSMFRFVDTEADTVSVLTINSGAVSVLPDTISATSTSRRRPVDVNSTVYYSFFSPSYSTTPLAISVSKNQSFYLQFKKGHADTNTEFGLSLPIQLNMFRVGKAKLNNVVANQADMAVAINS